MPPRTRKRGDIRVWSVLRAYFRAARTYSWLLAVALLSSILTSAAIVISPLYLRKAVNILSGTPTDAALHAALMAVVLYVLIDFSSWVIQRLNDFAVQRVEAHTMRDLYNDAFEKLFRHSHEFFISNFSGTLTRRVGRYARAFENIIDNLLYSLIPTTLFAIGVIGVLTARSFILGAALLLWTIAFLYVQYRMTLRVHKLREERSAADSDMTGGLSDAVVNHAAVTAFATLPRERTIFGALVARWHKLTVRTWTTDLVQYMLQGFFIILIEAGLLISAVFLWRSGSITVGDFLLIQIYILNLAWRLWNIGANVRHIYDAFAEATEMLDIIELTPDIVDKPDAKALAVSGGDIVFDKVRFAYHEGQNVLSDFDLHIAPHEKVALVGLSGAGKTTITKLLLRLYDIQDGAIRINGQSIADVTQESVRRAISFVPQEPVLFHRTLMENIRYGRADATDEEVIAAAKQAHCYEFISHYPEGFETLVGERGVKLSGGERQRVAIARAILKNAPILVLDEATSSLDSESEHLIQDALATLMEGKTVIAVAHRLSTVMKMDRIIVMEQGAVTLSGTHDALLSHEENLYKKLWEIQAGGFLDTAPAPVGVV